MGNHIVIVADDYHPIYRYLPKQFIDEFFENGALRIGSLRKSRAYKDNQIRRDAAEGQQTIISRDRRENTTYATVVDFSTTGFSLCTAAIYSRELLKKFDADSAIGISDIHGFLKEVTLAIESKGFKIGDILVGRCLYTNKKAIVYESHREFRTALNLPPDQGPLSHFGPVTVTDPVLSRILFNKPFRYSYQHEFRMIWDVKGKDVPDYVDIHIPNARQFCFRPDDSLEMVDPLRDFLSRIPNWIKTKIDRRNHPIISRSENKEPTKLSGEKNEQ